MESLLEQLRSLHLRMHHRYLFVKKADEPSNVNEISAENRKIIAAYLKAEMEMMGAYYEEENEENDPVKKRDQAMALFGSKKQDIEKIIREGDFAKSLNPSVLKDYIQLQEEQTSVEETVWLLVCHYARLSKNPLETISSEERFNTTLKLVFYNEDAMRLYLSSQVDIFITLMEIGHEMKRKKLGESFSLDYWGGVLGITKDVINKDFKDLIPLEELPGVRDTLYAKIEERTNCVFYPIQK